MVNLFKHFRVFDCKFTCSIYNMSHWRMSIRAFKFMWPEYLTEITVAVEKCIGGVLILILYTAFWNVKCSLHCNNCVM